MLEESSGGGDEYQFATHLIFGEPLKADTRDDWSAPPAGMSKPRLLSELELGAVWIVVDAVVELAILTETGGKLIVPVCTSAPELDGMTAFEAEAELSGCTDAGACEMAVVTAEAVEDDINEIGALGAGVLLLVAFTVTVKFNVTVVVGP